MVISPFFKNSVKDGLLKRFCTAGFNCTFIASYKSSPSLTTAWPCNNASRVFSGRLLIELFRDKWADKLETRLMVKTCTGQVHYAGQPGKVPYRMLPSKKLSKPGRMKKNGMTMHQIAVNLANNVAITPRLSGKTRPKLDVRLKYVPTNHKPGCAATIRRGIMWVKGLSPATYVLA